MSTGVDPAGVGRSMGGVSVGGVSVDRPDMGCVVPSDGSAGVCVALRGE